MSKWDKRFMEKASEIASWSKDTNTKVGAIVVDEDKIILTSGYNGFPRGCNDSIKSRFERPAKYMYTEHAERNALYHAARLGSSLKGGTMYATMFPCSDCARGIIQSGIIQVVAPKPDLNHHIWGESFKAALTMFKESKVKVKFL